jgi:glycosyltransferase involved in cell wall biosynthesis
MPKGFLHKQFIDQPVARPFESVYADIDSYSMEFFPEEVHYHEKVDVFVLLPPLSLDGVFTKGILMTQGADLLVQQFPDVKEYFHIGAYSMWCSYPWSRDADSLFVCYANPEREEWFKKTHPERVHQILIPIQDCDFTNEYVFAPSGEDKDIDVICVSKLEERKNLHLYAAALKCYREKHGVIRAVLIPGQDFDMNLVGLGEDAQQVFRSIQSELIHTQDYLHIVPKVPYHDLPSLYSRSKVHVLASLIEGKNRSLSEAMSCDTPVVCFEEFNAAARNGSPAFAPGAGLTCDYDPEAMADAIHRVLTAQADFQARRSFLHEAGRKRTVERTVEMIPEIRERIPEYDDGPLRANPWLEGALMKCYQLSLHSFLYDDASSPRAWVQGITDFQRFLEHCKARANR